MLIELEVEGVGQDANGVPVVVLRDKPEGTRVLHIWIGVLEAAAIHLELEGHHPPRPMTHDLIRSIFDELSVRVGQLVICDMRDETYYAELTLHQNGQERRLDCRPSDGIAIALRMQAPIFIPDELLSRVEHPEAGKGGFVVQGDQTIH